MLPAKPLAENAGELAHSHLKTNGQCSESNSICSIPHLQDFEFNPRTFHARAEGLPPWTCSFSVALYAIVATTQLKDVLT